MHNLCLIILATNTIFSDLMRITFPKLQVKLQPHPLIKIFWAKVEKVQKRIKLCIIMLINTSYRKPSNKRPGPYLIFQALRGALIQAGRLFFYFRNLYINKFGICLNLTVSKGWFFKKGWIKEKLEKIQLTIFIILFLIAFFFSWTRTHWTVPAIKLFFNK